MWRKITEVNPEVGKEYLFIISGGFRGLGVYLGDGIFQTKRGEKLKGLGTYKKK